MFVNAGNYNSKGWRNQNPQKSVWAGKTLQNRQTGSAKKIAIGAPPTNCVEQAEKAQQTFLNSALSSKAKSSSIREFGVWYTLRHCISAGAEVSSMSG